MTRRTPARETPENPLQALSRRLAPELTGFLRLWADPESRRLILRAHMDRRARVQEHRRIPGAGR